MVINGSVAQPQISNTFQPGGGNTQVGTAEQQPRPEQAQPARAPVAESQRADEQRLVRARQDDEKQRQQIAQSRAGSSAETPSEEQSAGNRGQILDLSV